MSAECSPGNIPPGYKQTEVGVIPKDWEVKLLGNTAILKTRIGWQGLTTSEYLECGDYYLVTGTEFKDGYIDWDNCHYVTESRYKQDKNIQLKENDILVTKDGTIGKVALINNLHKLATLNSGVFVIRPLNGAFHPVFFYYLLCSNLFKEFLAQLSAGSTINHLYQKDFVNFLYKTPPTKAEQEAIAEVLGDADAFIESLEQLISKKRQIKQGAMQELLTGKRRLPGFGEGKGYKQTDLGVIPEDWDVVNLADVGRSLAGLTYSPSNVRDFGTLVLRSSNVQNGKLVFEDNVYVDMALPERVIVEKDDILICVRNGSRQLIGKCALIDESAAGNAFGAFMSIYRSKYSKYVFYQFQSEIIQRQINEIMGATINQITNKDMASFIIPFPHSDEEKNVIAAILSDMDSEITALEEKLAKARQIKQGMMQELLTGRIRLL
ncbi:MAG: restriction endonuclease subunit S [Methanosarcina sp.]|jgi:type I restriction enzyme S subunit|nr:restriction endonuclease subunit S [Methanosarcina sp.]